MSRPKLAIYIPAYNAAVTLPRVLDRIPQSVKDTIAEIFVIDNHSPDHTYLLALGYKQEYKLQNLKVIRNPENMGYGGSQKVAYRYCIDQGFDFVAMLHGDAQYAPEYLEKLFTTAMEQKTDMVFGSRMLGDPIAGGMPRIRYLGNRFLTILQNWVLGTELSEFHSGYRVYSVEALRKIHFERLSSDYHFDTEIIMLLLEEGAVIKDTPIPTHYGAESQSPNVWKYGLHVLVTTLTYLAHKKGWRRSRSWARILGPESLPSEQQA